MPINDLFQAGTDKVLDDRASRPLPEPVPPRSFGANLWGLTSAVPKGITSGTAETAGFFSDILGAYGEVQAGYAAQLDPSLMLDPAKAEAVRKEGATARANIATGEAFSTEAGSSFRSAGRNYMPDSQSASTAENLLFGLGRFATKAIGYSVTAGPAAGAALVAADEGMAESERLKEQGVDVFTRTKVGLVAGATSGMAVALPVAGKTVGQTAALVLGGGPGGFIAQQAASKAILEHAGYDKIGSQYDPFDPVGLAVSTLVPAAFGAHGLRANRAAPAPGTGVRQLEVMSGNELRSLPYGDPRLDEYAVTTAQREGIPPEALLAIKNAGERSGSTAVSPAGAKGVMQFTDSTWAAYGKGDPRNPMASIDAGARYMKDLIAQYNGDVRAAIAHYNGGGKAGEAVRAGKEPPARETQDYLKRTEQYMAEKSGELAGRTVADDPEMVAAARVQQVRETVEATNLGDASDPATLQQHMDGILRAGDQIAAGERVDIGDAVHLDDAGQARLMDNFTSRLEQSRADLLPAVGAEIDAVAMNQLRAEITRLEESRPPATGADIRAMAEEIQIRDGVTYDAALSSAKKTIASRLEEINNQITGLRAQLEPARAAVEAKQQVAVIDQQLASIRRTPGAEPPRKVTLEESRAQHARQEAIVQEAIAKGEARKAGKPAAAPSETAPAKPTETNPAAASLEAQTAEITRLSPDMMVQLDGMDSPMRLADAMDLVRAEAARDIQDAPLLQVAAECFLRTV